MASPATQTANAIAAINNRSNLVIPEIDFTQHQLENGEIVSTTERVIKDVSKVRRSSGEGGGVCDRGGWSFKIVGGNRYTVCESASETS